MDEAVKARCPDSWNHRKGRIKAANLARIFMAVIKKSGAPNYKAGSSMHTIIWRAVARKACTSTAFLLRIFHPQIRGIQKWMMLPACRRGEQKLRP